MSSGNTQPIYATIYGDLRKKIFSGELAAGSSLPSESQLCAEYNASRETVRRGLRELESEGLIFVRPKIGYFVDKPNHEDYRITLSEEVENGISQYTHIHGVSAPDFAAEALDIRKGAFVFEFSRMIYNEQFEPIGYEEKYLPYERGYPSVEAELRYAVFPDITLSKMSSFSLYTTVQVQAVSAPENISEALACETGAPLLLVERVYIQQDRKKIGYSRTYLKSPQARLTGITGNRQ